MNTIVLKNHSLSLFFYKKQQICIPVKQTLVVQKMMLDCRQVSRNKMNMWYIFSSFSCLKMFQYLQKVSIVLLNIHTTKMLEIFKLMFIMKECYDEKI